MCSATPLTTPAVSTGILNIGPNAEGQGSEHRDRFRTACALGQCDLDAWANTRSASAPATATRSSTPSTSAPAPAPSPRTTSASFAHRASSRPGGSSTGFLCQLFLQGNASRYYRANQLGTYVQDKFQITPNLSLTAGIRYDWNGGLTEKYGRIFNFDPISLQLQRARLTRSPNPGFIIAGNNTNGTQGVSNTTLTGRQWGIGPRLGVAWQPEEFHSKVVVRTGFGMYYDRGELFSYFSPGYAIGTVTGGPFGVNQQLPFVTAQTCPTGTRSISTRATSRPAAAAASGGSQGPTQSRELPTASVPRRPRPPTPKASDLSNISQPTASKLNLRRRHRASSITASPSRSASTTAPTSCPTPSTTRWTSSGSRATTSPSKSATSATWAATR